jgi:hypothetical protein
MRQPQATTGPVLEPHPTSAPRTRHNAPTPASPTTTGLVQCAHQSRGASILRHLHLRCERSECRCANDQPRRQTPLGPRLPCSSSRNPSSGTSAAPALRPPHTPRLDRLAHLCYSAFQQHEPLPCCRHTPARTLPSRYVMDAPAAGQFIPMPPLNPRKKQHRDTALETRWHKTLRVFRRTRGSHP